MKRGDLFPAAAPYHYATHRVRFTGEVRRPRAFEWFISGALPEGYYAPSDLNHEYPIGELVKVRVKTVIEVIE